jgi:hypothetical protein
MARINKLNPSQSQEFPPIASVRRIRRIKEVKIASGLIWSKQQGSVAGAVCRSR